MVGPTREACWKCKKQFRCAADRHVHVTSENVTVHVHKSCASNLRRQKTAAIKESKKDSQAAPATTGRTTRSSTRQQANSPSGHDRAAGGRFGWPRWRSSGSGLGTPPSKASSASHRESRLGTRSRTLTRNLERDCLRVIADEEQTADEHDQQHHAGTASSSFADSQTMQESPSMPPAKRHRNYDHSDEVGNDPRRPAGGTMGARGRNLRGATGAVIKEAYNVVRQKGERLYAKLNRRDCRLEELVLENSRLKMLVDARQARGSDEGSHDHADEDECSLNFLALRAQNDLEAAGYPDLLVNFLSSVHDGALLPGSQPRFWWDLVNDTSRNLRVEKGKGLRFSNEVKTWCSQVYLSNSGKAAYDQARGPGGHGSENQDINTEDAAFNLVLPSPETVIRYVRKNSKDPDFHAGISDRKIAAFAEDMRRTALYNAATHGPDGGNCSLAILGFDGTDLKAQRRLEGGFDEEDSAYSISMKGGEDTGGILKDKEENLSAAKKKLELILGFLLGTLFKPDFNFLIISTFVS